MAGVIRMKTMLATVIDTGPTMNSSPNKVHGESSSSSKLAIAKYFLACYIVQKIMAIKTAEFCLVMNGDDYTNNYLNTNQGGGYERLNELFPMRRAGADIIETINSISCGSAPGDAIDGMVVGFDILDRTNVGKAYNKVLLLITDGETVIEGLEDLGPIVANMKDKDCAVYVLFLGKIDDNSSSTKVKNAGVLSDIASSTFGRFCEANDLADCFPLLTSAPGLSTKPRQQRFVFEISPYMRVPCVTWNKTKSISLPSLKKAPKISSGGDESVMSTVKTDLTYRNPADEDEEVSMVDRIKGYKYGAQYIPIQEDEERAFHVPGAQGIVLIGFVASSAVPRHHYMQKSVVFEGNPEIESAVKAVRSLHQAMLTTRTVALVRFVSKENSDPYLGALIPNTAEKDEASSFILHRLPVAEDIREYAFHSFNLSTLKSQQKESVSSFIDAMLVRNPLPSQLHPFNPTKVEIVLELQKRYLSMRGMDFETPSFREPLQPPVIARHFPLYDPTPPAAGKSASLQNLRSNFPLKVFVEGAEKKKIFWSDIEVSSGDLSSGNNSKKQRIDGETSSSTAIGGAREQKSSMHSALLAAATSAVQQFTAGSVNPIEEFASVMAAASALRAANTSSGTLALDSTENDTEVSEKLETARRQIVEEAMSAMTGVIEKMVTAGGSAAYHRKALLCLQAFRASAVEEAVCGIYNSFLIEVVKEIYSSMPRYQPFWDMVVAKGVSLISSAEVSESDIAPATAASFLLEDAVPVVVEAVKPVEAEEDDMFGEME